MIFITVGTTAFDSLIQAVDEISLAINKKIICQIADGNYIPTQCEYFRFKPTIEKEFRDAELIICHGGAGTLFKLLELRKKVIAVPNLERSDKHQSDLIDTLSAGNYIISCYKLSDLKDKILDIGKADLKKYEQPKCSIAEEIIKFIDR